MADGVRMALLASTPTAGALLLCDIRESGSGTGVQPAQLLMPSDPQLAGAQVLAASPGGSEHLAVGTAAGHLLLLSLRPSRTL
jgi:hypothetical protein